MLKLCVLKIRVCQIGKLEFRQLKMSVGRHRGKAVFGEVVSVSPCRRAIYASGEVSAKKWERAKLTAEPRSAYPLSGPARTRREHSIMRVALRYSITFRNPRWE
jgi:hypothetical protein